jgi:hypothetical protein
VDLTFSSQVRGHTWSVKCHTVWCTACHSYQLSRICSLLNQYSRARIDGAAQGSMVPKTISGISGECAILWAQLRFDVSTVWGHFKPQWLVFAAPGLTLKKSTLCSRSILITVNWIELRGGPNGSTSCYLWGTNWIFLYTHIALYMWTRLISVFKGFIYSSFPECVIANSMM